MLDQCEDDISISGRPWLQTGSGFPNMKKQDLNWDDVAVFLAVARAGSLSGAAGSLSMGLATVSRRIERFETALGHPLFLRHHSGYRLTEDGAAIMERAEEMEAAARALSSNTPVGPTVSGTVRLATAENLATELILPALPDLRRAYPALALELATDIATVNLHRRDADIALRMVKPERGRVSLQRLGTLGYGLYASEAYRETAPVAVERCDFIGWAEGYGHLPAAQWIERFCRERPPAVVTTSLAAQISACSAGLGLAILPHFVARPRKLVCLNPDLGVDQTIWLVTQLDLASSRRVQVVAEFLRELVGRNREKLAVGAAP